MQASRDVIGILASGGPAPGINSAIQAVAVTAWQSHLDVKGFRQGFQLNGGDALYPSDVEGIHLRGGCILQLSRKSLLDKKGFPDEKEIMAVLDKLEQCGVKYLVTIGGEDTAFSANLIAVHSRGKVKVAHLPKTIDNDLPLPEGIPTFGFTTAVQVGTEEVTSLMQDAHATNRWYLVVIMGRTAGHLALSVGINSGAPLILTPEEFNGGIVSSKKVVDILERVIMRRLHLDNVAHGVAVISEGIGYIMDPHELQHFPSTEIKQDESGHLRMAEVPLARILKNLLELQPEIRSRRIVIVEKDIGYELRSADPTAFDIQYTQLLGFGAVRYLVSKSGYEDGAMITVENGRIIPLPLSDVLDPGTGKIRIRGVSPINPLCQIAKMRMARYGGLE